MNSIDRLCKDLRLPKGSLYSQDWEYELPYEFRSEAWLKKYIMAYSNPEYGDEDLELLMNLMIDVSNDLVSEEQECNKTVQVVLDLLSKNAIRHQKLVEYWALEGDALEYCFMITPYVRQIRDGLKS